MNGATLFQLVETYARFGHHRTGALTEQRVTLWLTQELHARQAVLSEEPFEYTHYQSTVSDSATGMPLDAELLAYCWSGECEVSRPLVASLDAQSSEEEILERIESLHSKAQRENYDSVLVSTESQAGGLCGINRAFEPRFKIPVILISPSDLDKLQNSSLTLRCSASIDTRPSSNLRARFSHRSTDTPMVVTTPLTGWFHCAGERGTGLALAMEVAAMLSTTGPVDLLLARGHELGYIGGYNMKANNRYSPRFVLHLGSCIANINGQLDCRYHAPALIKERLHQALEPLSHMPLKQQEPNDADQWFGEAKCWASDEYPMLSIAGTSPLFHTQADLPYAATSPELLEKALGAITNATTVMAELSEASRF